MDISFDYVQMCESAIEIQKDHTFNEHDFVHYKNLDYNEEVGAAYDGKIWLPRQDQLQNIISSHVFRKVKRDVPEHFYPLDQVEPFFNHVRALKLKFNSFEKLWLSYIMLRMFDKRWDFEKNIWCNT